MAGSLNKVILIARLGRDVALTYTQSGQPVASFSVATDESYTGKDGQKVEKTEWHKIVVWGKQAEFCSKYLSKGRLVYIEGKLETRKWQDKDGKDQYSTEVKAERVVGLDKNPNAQASGPGSSPPAQSPAYNATDGMDEAPF